MESWFESYTRKLNSKVGAESGFWNRYSETKLESYYWKWFLKAKLGGETGNLCLNIKLKKESGKMVLRNKTQKKRKFGSAQHGFYEIGVFGLNFKNCFVLLRSFINRKLGNIKPQLHKALGVVGNLRATEMRNITIR